MFLLPPSGSSKPGDLFSATSTLPLTLRPLEKGDDSLSQHQEEIGLHFHLKRFNYESINRKLYNTNIRKHSEGITVASCWALLVFNPPASSSWVLWATEKVLWAECLCHPIYMLQTTHQCFRRWKPGKLLFHQPLGIYILKENKNKKKNTNPRETPCTYKLTVRYH